MNANHESISVEDLEIDLFLEGMFRAYGVDVRNCAGATLKNAVMELVRGAELRSVSALLEKLLHDRKYGAEAAAALGTRTINLFAEPDFYRTFREKVMPWLRTYPFSTIWAIQCGSGSDVYSIAILLEEAGVYDKTRIYATEADYRMLDRAAEGVSSPSCIQRYDQNYRSAGGTRSIADYFEQQGERTVVAAALKRNIVWAEYSIASGQTFNEFNLVLCRNIIGGLSSGLQRRISRLLTDSLSMFGLLALGKRERPEMSAYMRCYQQWDDAGGLYQRVC